MITTSIKLEQISLGLLKILRLHPDIAVNMFSILCTVSLFWIEGVVDVLDAKNQSNLFNVNQFIAIHEIMKGLRDNNLTVAVTMMRSAYVAHYAAMHEGKNPTQEQINQIRTEGDYLRIVNMAAFSGELATILNSPLKKKKVWRRLQMLVFVLLVSSQIANIALLR